MRILIPFSAFLCLLQTLPAATLHVGSGQQYATLTPAAAAADPGDTILIHNGTYAGGLYIANLQGAANQWITIKNAPGATVIFEGGGNAIQFTDPAYLHFKGLIFQHQTGNGLNMDDGGSYDTPARHVIFENCTFRDMSATGNNDLLKLSGLDHFEVRNCTFLNGATGGSGIDMVGCHQGVIQGNTFENLGSNSIQCKGGSEWIRIEGNFFKNGGQRTLNLGGSTGLAFFRPDTAHFEAANLQVYSNVIVGSWAPVAYVGSVNVAVVNNTIYQPQNWVVRILQETVDPDRFVECGDNAFINNIVYLGDNISTETNIGPNTRPETFVFSNNLWFNADDANWSGPNIPVTDPNEIVNSNPLFVNPLANNFHIPANSPAAGAGISLAKPEADFYGQLFADPPSIGAVEANPVSGVVVMENVAAWQVFPNPSGGRAWTTLNLEKPLPLQIDLFDMQGRHCGNLFEGVLPAGENTLPVNLSGAKGVYYLRLKTEEKTWTRRVIFTDR